VISGRFPAIHVLTLAVFLAAWPVGAHAQPASAPATPTEASRHTPAQATAQSGDAQPQAGQPAHGQPPAHGEEGAHDEAHAESPLAFASRIANFLILAGLLYHFLRKPISTYLADRDRQIRHGLVTAKDTTATAAAQLAEIDRKLQALPAEIAALKGRGAEEIAAEEARIRRAAEAERQRLIEQTRREIALQVRLAKRELTEHGASLAVELARSRITQTITPEDQARLIDRYVGQVRKAHD
jgi:F-type H+-transporting ATPase subunit b